MAEAVETGLLLQYLIVGLAVAASLAYVVWTRFPGTVRRVRGWCALRLVDSGRPRLARLGRAIAPAPRAGGSCGGCDGCDPD